MSDLEKELDDLQEEEQDISEEFENLADFVDLEDLESLAGEESFADLDDLSELGDLSDLGDLSELDDISALTSEDSAEADGESEPDTGEDISALLPEADEGAEIDSPLPQDGEPAAEEADIRSVLPEADSGEAGDDLDNMLDGLLADLDNHGELTDEQKTEEEKEEAIPEEGGMDELLDMLKNTEASSDEGDSEDVLALSETDVEEPTEKEEDSEDEMDALLDSMTQEKQEPGMVEPEGKNPGLLKRLFGNVVTDEIAEQELAAREAEKDAELLRKEEEEKAKEEKAAKKAEKAEEKAVAKAAKAEEKALKKAAKAEEKAARKAEKAARKAEEEAQAELEVTGRLNKVGVSIIAILTVMFLLAEISGTNIFSYRSTLKEAKDYFGMQKYTQAYQEILGTDVKKKDRETYDKIITVMKVQRSINSYNNYSNMKYYPDALNALLRGVQRYDENIEKARSLDVDGDLDSCRKQILSLLQEEFGVSEQEAYDLLSMEKEAYTDKVVEIGIEAKN